MVKSPLGLTENLQRPSSDRLSRISLLFCFKLAVTYFSLGLGILLTRLGEEAIGTVLSCKRTVSNEENLFVNGILGKIDKKFCFFGS